MPDRILAGRYRLGEPLGRGGMALVWFGTDTTLGRDVAVKTLDLTGPDRDSASARFEREARATARLNHPNIVTVYDHGVDGDTAYIVMELIEGPTLADRVRDAGPLEPAEVRSLAAGVCAALASAHAAGIVHRDIKPNNIAYAADGTPKVLDFGITHLLDEAQGPGLTRTNTIVGTAEYLSPEQATGQPVDARADLYALGCVLFFALTGRPPFQAPTPVAVLLKHTGEPAPDVRDVRPEVPTDLAGAVAMLLAKDPDERPASAAEAAEVVAGRRAAAPPTVVLAPVGGATEVLPAAAPTSVLPATRPGGPVGPPPRPVARRRGGWVPWLLTLLALGLAGYLLWGAQDGTGTPAPTGTTSTRSTSTPPRSVSRPPTTTSRTTTTTSTTPTTPTTPTTVTPDLASAIASFRSALESATAAGQVDPDAHDALLQRLDDVQAATGKPGQVRKAVDELGREVEKQVKDGAVTEQGAARLAGPYSALRAAAG